MMKKNNKSVEIIFSMLNGIGNNKFLEDYRKISLQKTKNKNYCILYDEKITGIFVNKNVIDENEIMEFGWKIKKYAKPDTTLNF